METVKSLLSEHYTETNEKQNALIDVLMGHNLAKMNKEILQEIAVKVDKIVIYELGRERTCLRIGFLNCEKKFLLSTLISSGVEFNDRIDVDFIIKNNPEHFELVMERNEKRNELIENGACDKLDAEIELLKKTKRNIWLLLKEFDDKDRISNYFDI